MKGFELVKREDHWALYNEDGHKIAATIPGCNSKLSIKNCEAIENGYDLMKLAEENSHKYYDVKTTDWHCNYNGFFSGFQKALELLGDKKYNETDLYRAFLINSAGNDTTLRDFFEQTVLPTFQQNEWDVEICCYIGNGDKESDSFKDSIVTNTGIPKLDENGCLILRRQNEI